MGIHYFRDKKKFEMLRNLLDAENREETLKKITALQNEISIVYDTKMLVITSVEENDDDLAAAFAKAMADTYVHNGSNVLIIDANLYEPRLADMLGVTPASAENQTQPLDEKNGAIFMAKETYPSIIFKSGVIHQLIKDGHGKFEHVLVLVPSIKKHKELALLGDILDSVLLVTRRDVTAKRDIYEALEFCHYAKLPVSKTVIIK